MLAGIPTKQINRLVKCLLKDYFANSTLRSFATLATTFATTTLATTIMLYSLRATTHLKGVKTNDG